MSSKAEQRSQRSAKAHAVDQGVMVLSYLIGGVVVYGGLGWLGDHFFDTSFLLPIGIVLGAALAVYTIIKRFGGVDGGPLRTARRRGPDADDDH